MGMTMVEKILARATGQEYRQGRRCGRTEGGFGDVAREWGVGAEPVPRNLQGYRPGSQRLGSVENRDHLRSPCPGREFEDRHQPEDIARVCRGAGHHQVP